MPEEKNSRYPFPSNLGCTYIDSKGIECAKIGCWAKALVENAADLGDKADKEVKRVEMMARNAGCQEV